MNYTVPKNICEIHLFPEHVNSHRWNYIEQYIFAISVQQQLLVRMQSMPTSDLKRSHRGWTRAVSPSTNHWIMLIASDEWYYSVTPATLMAIHLAPSLPVILQPHVFWKRVDREDRPGVDVSRTFVHQPFRSGSRFVRARVRDYAAFPQSPRWFNLLFIRTVDTDTCSIRRDAARRSRREINHLEGKRDEVTNEVGLRRRIIVIIQGVSSRGEINIIFTVISVRNDALD